MFNKIKTKKGVKNNKLFFMDIMVCLNLLINRIEKNINNKFRYNGYVSLIIVLDIKNDLIGPVISAGDINIIT